MRTTILALGFAGAMATAWGQSAAPKAKILGGSSYIGVMVQEIDGDRAKELKLREEYGVEVTRIEPDSPADKAGLKVGDTIQQYNGQRVEGMEEFKRLVSETPAGREVKLDIIRGGAPQTLTVKVAQRHLQNALSAPHAMPSPAPSPMPMTQFEMHLPDFPRSFLTWK